MPAVGPTITITFADTGTPALTEDAVAALTAKIIALMASRVATPTYGSGTIALAVT